MNIVFTILGVVIFIVFLLPIFQQVLNFGNLLGMALGVITLAVGLLFNSLGAKTRLVLSLAVSLVLIVLFVLCVVVYLCGKTTATNQKVLIVLGCRVKGDVPSLALQKRVDSAYDFLASNSDSVAVLSGGQGSDELLSEALCMKKLLVSRGIGEERLFLEEQSVNTDQNIAFSLELIKQNNLPLDIAVATSEYHLLRARVICNRHSVKGFCVASHTMAILLPTFLLREVFGLTKEIFLKN